MRSATSNGAVGTRARSLLIFGCCLLIPMLRAGAQTWPEIDVMGNSVVITNGDVTPSAADLTDFGAVRASSQTVVRTFTIRNTGSATLNLTGNPRVAVAGADASAFTVTLQPAPSLASGFSTTFQVTFAPSAARTFSAELRIISDDADEGQYEFAIAGTGTAPEIDVQGNSVSIDCGDATPSLTDHTDFGAVLTGVPWVERTFTIRNEGGAPLNLNGNPQIAIGGVDAAQFTVTAGAQGLIAAGGTTTFTIRFAAPEAGTYAAVVSIASDDADEDPYVFAIRGTGIAPAMTVEGNSNTIDNGDDTPSLADHTDFWMVLAASGTVVRTFAIRNTGTAPLHLDGIPKVKIEGPNAAEFAVTAQPTGTVAAGDSAPFEITFDPAAIGLRTATVSIANDDPDDDPYVFSIQGRGTQPEIDVQGNSNTIDDGDSTPSLSDHTDFGPALFVGGRVARTFTIRNLGLAPLHLTGSPRVSIGGISPGDFSVTVQPTDTVTAVGTTTFEVTFDPTGIGLRSATLTIASDDADENPYTFAIQGTATEPEMDVQGNAVSIADGDGTPGPADHTDFGSALLAGGTAVRTFTIRSTGTAELSLTGTPKVVIDGLHATDFSVTAEPSSPVAIGSTTTFQVTFDPSAVGFRFASVSIASDDLDENPYNFSIQGTGTAPEIDVQGGGITIADGDTTPNLVDLTDFGSASMTGTSTVRRFVIRNTGNAALNLTGTPRVAVSGMHSLDFTVTQQPATPVAAGGTTSVEVAFFPTGPGVRTATLSIVSDDADENPYTFSIQGTGTEPEMEVQGNAASIANGDFTPSPGDHTDFGSVLKAGGFLSRTFTIRNTGSAALNLTGTPRVAISGTHAADFTVTSQPATPVGPAASTTFMVSFDPSATGLRTATISIENDDANEHPYTFGVQGTGVAPEIDVLGNSVSIADGDTSPGTDDHTDFGQVSIAGSSVMRTYTVRNIGTSTLNLTGNPRVALSGTHAADFSVTVQPSAFVAPGTSTTFDVWFDPSATGGRTATLSIASDDEDENPYTFAIQGMGTEPEIDVRGDMVSIADGDITPSTADLTDFGSASIAGGTVVRAFTIHNSGQAPLNLTGSPRVAVGGANAAEFTVTLPPSPLVPYTGSTTCLVTFAPAGLGVRTASLSIANDDANENPYTFSIQGTGIVAEMDVLGNGVSIACGDSTPALSDHTDFGPVPAYGAIMVSRVFTIRNTGNAALNLTGTPRVTFGGPYASEFHLIQQPGSQVAIGGEITFEVVFDPAAIGVSTAVVSIANDDAEENPYTFAIRGTGTGVEIDVQGNSVSIVNGDTTPSADDHTDFGLVPLTDGTAARTFTIRNLGNVAMNLTGSPRVMLHGTHAADFAVTAQPPASVGGGSSATFTVMFDPTATGPRSATLRITNDDIDENPFEFLVRGIGTVAPEMLAPASGPGEGVILRWTSTSNHYYDVQQSADPRAGWSVLQADLAATPPVNAYTGSVHAVTGRYWRVSTQE